MRILIPFLLAGLLGFVYPEVLGGGHGIVEGLSADHTVGMLALLLAVRFLFSLISFGSGAPGGIFLPLLVLGAVLGCLVGQAAGLAGLSVPIENFIILGMAGFFACSRTRAYHRYFADLRNDRGRQPSSFVCSCFHHAYAVADLLHAEPIYDQLLRRDFKKRKAVKRFKNGNTRTQSI